MNLSYICKSLIVSSIAITSFILMAIASNNNSRIFYFHLAILASVFTGLAQGLGEATMLGYMNMFPSHLVGYISSGTGFAGILGTFTLLLLQSLNFSNTTIFLIAIPTIFIYQFNYFWLNLKLK